MQFQDFIPVKTYCQQTSYSISFIDHVADHGLVEVTEIASDKCIPIHQIDLLEKIARMHYEMDINLEGIETIFHLLEKMEQMEAKMNALQNRLHFYEQE